MLKNLILSCTGNLDVLAFLIMFDNQWEVLDKLLSLNLKSL